MGYRCTRCGRQPSSDESLETCQGGVVGGGGYVETCGGEFETYAEMRWVAWHVENHRDREMTFLGVFSSREHAEAACTAHREGQVFRREYEYTIREYEVDRPEV